MTLLSLVSLISSLLFFQAVGMAQPKPADVFKAALKAVEGIESVEYEVRGEIQTSAGVKFKTRTTILATRSPFQFSAKLQGEDTPIRQIAVSDGKMTRASYDGRVDETSTFASRYPKEKLMPILNQANRDVSATWRLLLDADFLKEALASGNTLYVKQEDVEGDLCNVVLYVRDSEVFESMSEYFWFSAETGLPRAVQRLTLTRGHANLFPRFTISKIKRNATIPAGIFSYRPTASDSYTAPMSKPAATEERAERSLVGSQLPDLEVRDMEFKPMKLSDLGGKPLLVTFWAPWCAPCLAEFPVLQKIQASNKGGLQVVAVAVQDSRLNVLKFVKENPRYEFTFLTDPDMQESESRLGAYFDLGLNGIPVSIFIDTQGKIVDHWFGFKEGEQALISRVQRLMSR